MTSISPKRLNEPAIQDYAFINLMFQGSVFGFAAENGEYPMGDIELRSRINDKYFDWPSEVTAETLSILNNMTDQTFEGLCAILQFKSDDFVVKTKADLQSLCELRKSRYKACEENELADYRDEQLVPVVLFNCEMTKNTHWGNLTKLYNGSAPDQQEAIDHYFNRYHGHSLDILLNYAGKSIDVPDMFDESFESREHAGNTYLFSKDMDKWLREDRFHQQYRVDVSVGVSKLTIIRATAPTLKLAVAKATLLATSSDILDSNRLEIMRNGIPVFHAEVVKYEVEQDDAPGLVPKAKLRWDLTNIGPDKTHLVSAQKIFALAKNDYETAGAHKLMEDHRQKLQDLSESFKPPIPSHVLLKTVLDVEKKLKLQWSKVYRLQDDLGM